MKVLVTGAAGFIGSHVVDALQAQGARVIGLDSLDPGVHHGPPDYLRRDLDYCFADLRDWEPDSRLEDVEAIVHLAALGGVLRASREPSNVVGANCLGTARLLELAKKWHKLRRVILGSSFSIYGSSYEYHCLRCSTHTRAERRAADLERGVYEVLCPNCGAEAAIRPIRESAPPAPLEAYGASKYMQELCFRGFDHAPVSILRFSSVYGTRLRLDDGEATIIARLAGWIRAGVRPRLYEDGLQIRDWVLVNDVVEAIVRLANEGEAAALLNVCSGVPTTLLEACRHIAEALGVSCEPEVVGGFRPGDMRHCLGDASGLRQLLGREPVAFRQGAVLAFGSLGKPGVRPIPETPVPQRPGKCAEF